MNKETAIDLLDNLIGMVEDNQENDYDTALKMGIQALQNGYFKVYDALLAALKHDLYMMSCESEHGDDIIDLEDAVKVITDKLRDWGLLDDDQT